MPGWSTVGEGEGCATAGSPLASTPDLATAPWRLPNTLPSSSRNYQLHRNLLACGQQQVQLLQLCLVEPAVAVTLIHPELDRVVWHAGNTEYGTLLRRQHCALV